MTIKLSSKVGGSGVIGGVVYFPAQFPTEYKVKSETYLRSGFIETNTSKFDTSLWGKLWLPKNSNASTISSLIAGAGSVVIKESSNNISRSIDGGKTFTSVTPAGWSTGGANTRSAKYANGVYTLVVPAGNTNAGFWNSKDDGVTWIKTTVNVAGGGVDNFGGQVWVGGRTDGGAVNYIQRSTDGGDNWSQVTVPVSDTGLGHYVISKPTNKSIGLIISDSYILRTADAGLTWSVVMNSGSAAWTLGTDGAGKWLLNQNGTLYLSTDDGLTFNQQTTTVGTVSGDLDYDTSTGTWWSESSYSLDGGITWSAIGNVIPNLSTLKMVHPFASLGYSATDVYSYSSAAGVVSENVVGTTVAYTRIS